MAKAVYEISEDGDTTTVAVSRHYPAGVPLTAPRVWEIVATFGAPRTIFPSLVRVDITYPDANEGAVGTVRDMTFLVPGAYPLANGIEQLVELDVQTRRLKYVSLTGLPATNYQSVMEVVGEDDCVLNWTSTFTTANPDFPKNLAGILTAGADQIATALNLDSQLAS